MFLLRQCGAEWKCRRSLLTKAHPCPVSCVYEAGSRKPSQADPARSQDIGLLDIVFFGNSQTLKIFLLIPHILAQQ